MICDCCDHPLQHAIREALAHDAAPMPLAAREPPVIFANLRAALEAWEANQ